MGNGSSSAKPTNTVTVQPSSSNQTNFCSVPSSSSPMENNSVSRFQNNGSIPSNDLESSSGYRSFQQQDNLSSLNKEVEIDDSIESAVAPRSASFGYDNLYGMEATTSQRNSKSKQKRNKNLKNVVKEPEDTKDEVIFEVYRSHDNGVEYTVINNDGVRFYLDSWTTGNIISLFSFLFLLICISFACVRDNSYCLDKGDQKFQGVGRVLGGYNF